MHVNQMFPSNFLKASDLNNGERTLIISAMEAEQLGSERKFLLRFSGDQKRLVLNKTNARTIAKAYGPDTKGWLGKAITLYESQVDFRGDLVPGVRVKIPTAPQAAADPLPFDDDIPL